MTSKKQRHRRMTAEELVAHLAADPEWSAERERRDAEAARKLEWFRQVEAPLLEDLCLVGHDVQSVWDLVNTSVPYPGALPVLVDHLRRDYPDEVRDGIARSLAVRDASFAWPELVHMLREEKSTIVEQGLAAAVAESFTTDDLPTLVELIRTDRRDAVRALLVAGLRRRRDRASREALKTIG